MIRWLAVAGAMLALSVAHFAEGAEVKIEGVLKAVDSEERLLTIERTTPKGTKELSLEAAEEAGDLSALKVGERITVSYDSTLEVVSKIIGITGQMAKDDPAPPRASPLTADCPNTQLGDEQLQAQYDALWKAYGDTLAKSANGVESELNRLYEEATADGNLDLAIQLRDLKKGFAETGRLALGGGDDKKGKKKSGEGSIAEKLNKVVAAFDAETAEARKSVEKGYKVLEETLTKADKIDLALAIRNESQGLWKKGAVPPNPSKPQPDPAIVLGLKGKAEYNPKTRELTLRYDFSSAEQLKDFRASPQQSVANIRQGLLVIEPNGILTHKVEYDSIEISGKMIVPMPRGEKKPAMRLGVSANRKVFAYGSGSIRTDDGWVDVGGLKYGQPTQFRWAVGTPQMGLWVEGKQGLLPCNLSTVGAAVMEGSDQGCAFEELMIGGKVAAAVAEVLSKR